MENHEALLKATEIARSLHAQARREEMEQSIRLAEKSESPVLRSLARAYRMLQNPFR